MGLTQNTGSRGENEAELYLKKKGYKIITRNYHSRFGEIDIIAQVEDTLVFVEVKTRSSVKFGYPSEFITTKKLWKMVKTAEFFRAQNKNLPAKFRFDAIEVFSGNSMSINHIENITL